VDVSDELNGRYREEDWMRWTACHGECSRGAMAKLAKVFRGTGRNYSLTFFSRAYSKSLRTLSPVITPA
jgi:hypothetical protein